MRAITPGRRILSWYCEVDKFSLYLPERPANGNGRSPEQARYEAAWQRATTMQEELTALLRRHEHTVHTDGVIALNLPRLLRGTTALINIQTVTPAISGD